MPELPEVETIRRSLASKIRGRKIKKVLILKPKMFRGDPKNIIETKVIDLQRRAKILFIKLSNNKYLMIHLKLNGQLIWLSEAKKTVPSGKTTHIIIFFDKGRLFFNDLRQFGWIKIISDFKKETAKIGVEPFSREFTVKYLSEVFCQSKRAVKLVLMDQEKIAGLGNIYSSEALWEAKISPLRPSNSLESKEVKKLREAILKVLKEGIEYKGASAADQAYIQPLGEKGSYQEHLRVYQQDGEKCARCGGIIKRVKLGGRGTFYCPKCQGG